MATAAYGDLKGYEAAFNGMANGEKMDIKVIVGNAQGKGPVNTYAYTLRDKLDHLSESIRRSWGNAKYLN